MYHVEIINSGNSTFRVQSKDYEFVVDTEGKGITPPDVLLAGLGSCLGVYLRKYAGGAKLTLGEFSISADAEFSKESPVCFKKISLRIDLKGIKLDQRRLKAMAEFIKNCPVHNTLKNNPEVEITIQ
ncbi:MAG: OsmC family protein [Candidatus Omnitrophota bacterium]|jgi:uncharacterized OsmC-like protein